VANWSGRFCPETPQKLPETQNTSRAFPPLNKRSHITTETPLLKNPSRQPRGLNRSDRFGKPVRPVLPGQSGRTQPAGKNSKLQAIDLPIRSTDQSETLGVVGAPRTFLILVVPHVSFMQASFNSCHLVISFPSASSQCGANQVKRINPQRYAKIKSLQVISTSFHCLTSL
jgi:hypothetical protein